MGYETERIREINWLEQSIKDQIRIPENRIDSFWVHHDLVALLNVKFWQELIRQTADLNCSLGFLHSDTTDNGHSDQLIVIYSDDVGPEEAAEDLFDIANDLMVASCKELPFVELYTPEASFQLDVITGDLELR